MYSNRSQSFISGIIIGTEKIDEYSHQKKYKLSCVIGICKR